jgi:hypothetical protein
MPVMVLLYVLWFAPILAWVSAVLLVFRCPDCKKVTFLSRCPACKDKTIVGTKKEQLIALYVSVPGLVLAWFVIALFRGWLPAPPSAANVFLILLLALGPILVTLAGLIEIIFHKKVVYLIPMSAWLVNWWLLVLALS